MQSQGAAHRLTYPHVSARLLRKVPPQPQQVVTGLRSQRHHSLIRHPFNLPYESQAWRNAKVNSR